ncbi:hypothetical protein Tco_0524151 [Tanacetum coccineum]
MIEAPTAGKMDAIVVPAKSPRTTLSLRRSLNFRRAVRLAIFLVKYLVMPKTSVKQIRKYVNSMPIISPLLPKWWRALFHPRESSSEVAELKDMVKAFTP